jgi:hypothetical protein
MRNFTFMVWMLLWPLSTTVNDYLTKIVRQTADIKVDSFYAAVYFGMWFGIGYLLYERRPPRAIERAVRATAADVSNGSSRPAV